MLIYGVNPDDLSQAGWGVIFAGREELAVKQALRPLLEHRQAQAGDLYRELEYVAPESALRFLARHGIGLGPVDPKNIPFYLLLVGSPELIPFEFQYQLNIQHAVGRLHFDRPEGYAHYAENVLAIEKQKLPLPRRAAFISVQNHDDRATALVAHQLVEPLVADLTARFSDWSIEMRTGQQASKSAVQHLLAHDAPRLLFISAHGYVLRPAHERQRDYQGALICQDWPGPESGPISEHHVLSADDIGRDMRLAGSLVFLFSSNSAGTPLIDDFPHEKEDSAKSVLALRPFISRLAQRLLSHDPGGALAVVGHVDRVWTLSFRWVEGRYQVLEDRTFHDILWRLLQGHPVGWAMRPMAYRYAALAAQLAELLHDRQAGQEVPKDLIARLWTGQIDARNYVVLGDPAVQIST